MTADDRIVTPRRSLVALGGIALTLTLAACSSSSSGSTGGGAPAAGSSTSPAAARAGGGGGGSGAFGNRGPAASGQIAAITGTTMQVQNQRTGQVAVTWTTSTTFSHTVTVKASAIKVGSCVTAVAPSGTSATTASFTAATLIVSQPRNGSCSGGFGGGTHGFPSGARPSGFPSGARPSGARPSGFAGGTAHRQFGAVASGKVTAVAGSTITVAARDFQSSQTVDKKVTIGASTKITAQAATTAKSLQVGKCVTAQGKADSSGTVTATRVQISDPTNGTCTTGFGRVGSGG